MAAFRFGGAASEICVGWLEVHLTRKHDKIKLVQRYMKVNSFGGKSYLQKWDANSLNG
jgi:hypothetical protein